MPRSLVALIVCTALLASLVGCASLQQAQAHDSVVASVSARIVRPNGDVQETSASLAMSRAEFIGDKVTTISLSVKPTGEAKVEGGMGTTKQSAVDALDIAVGAVLFLFGKGF